MAIWIHCCYLWRRRCLIYMKLLNAVWRRCGNSWKFISLSSLVKYYFPLGVHEVEQLVHRARAIQAGFHLAIENLCSLNASNLLQWMLHSGHYEVEYLVFWAMGKLCSLNASTFYNRSCTQAILYCSVCVREGFLHWNQAWSELTGRKDFELFPHWQHARRQIRPWLSEF